MAGHRLRPKGHRPEGRVREIASRRIGRPPQRELPARRRRQIIEAAFEVFTADGYEATAISEVAARAGIGQGTVYHYFGSKREILDHVIDLGIEKVSDAMELDTVLGTARDVGELVAVVRAAVARLWDLLEREPRVLRLLVVEAGAIDPELAHRLLGLEALTASLPHPVDRLPPHRPRPRPRLTTGPRRVAAQHRCGAVRIRREGMGPWRGSK